MQLPRRGWAYPDRVSRSRAREGKLLASQTRGARRARPYCSRQACTSRASCNSPDPPMTDRHFRPLSSLDGKHQAYSSSTPQPMALEYVGVVAILQLAWRCRTLVQIRPRTHGRRMYILGGPERRPFSAAPPVEPPRTAAQPAVKEQAGYGQGMKHLEARFLWHTRIHMDEILLGRFACLGRWSSAKSVALVSSRSARGRFALQRRQAFVTGDYDQAIAIVHAGRILRRRVDERPRAPRGAAR